MLGWERSPRTPGDDVTWDEMVEAGIEGQLGDGYGTYLDQGWVATWRPQRFEAGLRAALADQPRIWWCEEHECSSSEGPEEGPCWYAEWGHEADYRTRPGCHTVKVVLVPNPNEISEEA